MFDGVSLADQPFTGSPSLPPLNLGQPSPGQQDPNTSYEQLVAANANLRMRVSELEVINMVYSDNENNLRSERDSAMRERDEFKRKVEDLEKQLKEVTDLSHPNKKVRLDEATDSSTNNE
jgi:GATA-binding protein, other eukaryote